MANSTMANNTSKYRAILQLKVPVEIPLEIAVEVQNLQASKMKLLDDLASIENRLNYLRHQVATETIIPSEMSSNNEIHRAAWFY